MIHERGDEQQAKSLQDALANVKREAYYMKQEIDKENVEQSLLFAGLVLRELRTGKLTPTNYYELWIAVTDQLRHLQMFFADLSKQQPRIMVDLYQRVQYASSVVPRLYLLCTVGGVFIESMQAPANIVLNDLVEMAKGVQHPIRGLFLRNYLSQVTKDILPDEGSQSGTVQDSVNFILKNFGEMNRLWIRMQFQGKTRDRPVREKDRKELKLLIGTNLVRLSQLEGVTVELYKTKVLPKVLEQIVNGKDRIAQEYLMDCLIQVFPVEFHIATLNEFLESCAFLSPDVNVGQIITTLMSRIASHGSANDGYTISSEAFDILEASVAKVVEQFEDTMLVTNVLSTYAALLDFAVSCYPQNTATYVDRTLLASSGYLSKPVAAAGAPTNPNPGAAISLTEKLLTTPLKVLSIRVLGLQHYPSVMAILPWESRRSVAANLLESVLASNISLCDVTTVERLLHFISPLLMNNSANDEEFDQDQYEFEEHQHMVGKLIHRIINNNLDAQYAMLAVANQYCARGGPTRLRYTTLPLAYRFLELAQRIVQSSSEDKQESDQSADKQETSTDPNVENREESTIEEDTAAAVVTDAITENPDESSASQKAGKENSKDLSSSSASNDGGDVKVATNTKKMKAENLESSDEENNSKPDESDKYDAAAQSDSNEVATIKNESEVKVTLSKAAEKKSATGVMKPKCDVNPRQIFQNVHEMIMRLSEIPGCAPSALRLFLQAAQVANHANEEAVTYEFVVQGFTIYEEYLDSKLQGNALKLMIGTVQQCAIFEKDNFETLVAKLIQYASRMLKKPDQCRMMYTCAQLFWPPRFGEDGKRTLECLQKSLKIADACVGTSNALLFVELLNQYVYFLDKGLERIQVKYISGLVELVNDQLSQDGNASMEVRTSFAATLQHIRSKVKLAESVETSEDALVKRYAGLKV